MISLELEIQNLFRSVPARYKRTRRDLGDTGGNPNDVFLSMGAINWMLNNTSNRELRRRIRDLKRHFEQQCQ